MSNNIYTSEKVAPYVYWGTHKISGQFYIGRRHANIRLNIPSHLDIGIKYFTSSEKVKELGFENFNWIIIAECLSINDVIILENDLITQNIKHPLNINGNNNGKFYNKNNRKLSDVTKQKISIGNTGKIRTKETKQLLRYINLGKTHSEETKKLQSENAKNHNKTEEHIKNNAIARTGAKRTEEHKANMRAVHIGKKLSEDHIKAQNEGKRLSREKKKALGIPNVQVKVICPHCGLEGGKSAMVRYHFDNCKKKV